MKARGRVKTLSESALHVSSKTRYAYFSYFLFAAVPFSAVEIVFFFFSFKERNFCFLNEERRTFLSILSPNDHFFFSRLFLRRKRYDEQKTKHFTSHRLVYIARVHPWHVSVPVFFTSRRPFLIENSRVSIFWLDCTCLRSRRFTRIDGKPDNSFLSCLCNQRRSSIRRSSIVPSSPAVSIWNCLAWFCLRVSRRKSEGK